MDFTQNKLVKLEWDSIEKNVYEDEKNIIKMIINGFYNIDITFNKNISILGFMKISIDDDNIDSFNYQIFEIYLLSKIKKIKKSYKINFEIPEEKKIKNLKKADKMRIEQSKKLNIEKMDNIYEFGLLYIFEKMLKYHKAENDKYIFYYYTLEFMLKYNIKYTNIHLLNCINNNIENIKNKISYEKLILNSRKYIEQNKYILQYQNIELYEHQKKIFNLFNVNNDEVNKQDFEHYNTNGNPIKNYDVNAKLILYIAPTATGKTLTPISISQKYRIIYVCAARHVGLALAKSAISADRKVAFAFGCNSASDIRLHNFAANTFVKKDDGSGKYIKHKNGMKKIDNSDGSKVEIMICDIRSYEYAMYYMLEFNNKYDLIMFWDEPTIFLDYETHENDDESSPSSNSTNHIINGNENKNKNTNSITSLTVPLSSSNANRETTGSGSGNGKLDTKEKEKEAAEEKEKEKQKQKQMTIRENHNYVHNVWSKNKIPKIVLSSATLPNINELSNVVNDFNKKFKNDNPIIESINSNDCKKTIPLLDNNYYTYVPHNICSNYNELKESVGYCNNNLTLLRYFDLHEISCFIKYILKQNFINDENLYINNYFTQITDINMKNIKNYYLKLLEQLTEEQCNKILKHFNKDSNKDTRYLENENNLETNGTHISSYDAYTLTDGPTIYMTNKPNLIGKFCLKQLKIPNDILSQLLDSIRYNNVIRDKISVLEQKIEEYQNDNAENENKINNEKRMPPEIREAENQVKKLINELKSISLDEIWIPNSISHIKKWVSKNILDKVLNEENMPFRSQIYEDDVLAIMKLTNIDDIWKLLLILGIGVFDVNVNKDYLEIMKKLADNQRLYLIIACDDYIYGTNYQFCHGFIGKDLDNISQEKLIQAIGRVGRNSIQKDYTVRFRNIDNIKKIFTIQKHKPEVINMNKLFITE